jgi:hypothetical protein
MCPRIHDLPNERKQKNHDGAGGLNDYVIFVALIRISRVGKNQETALRQPF